jgi:hypothetical protein
MKGESPTQRLELSDLSQKWFLFRRISKMPEDKYKQDFEDDNDFVDSNPIEFWEKKQRELVTSVVDYNLSTLAGLIKTKDIDLSPTYQRRFRWDNARQSRLIESFLMNVPVPPVFLNEDKYGQYSVIDGKQRLTAIYEFLRGRLVLSDLEIFSDINGLNFDQLPSRLQTVIRTRPTIRSVIILRQSDEDVKFEVFKRLNTGGAHLNAQEIRNSTHPGELNDMILELSVNKKFHKLLGIKNREKSAIYQEMRDAELVLRFFALRETWNDLSGGIRRVLDMYMSNNQAMPSNQVEQLKQDFLKTLDVVEMCFSEHAFQRWSPKSGKWRQVVLASLFDAEMIACQDLSIEAVAQKKEKILEGLKELFSNEDFLKAVDSAKPYYLRDRINMMRNMIYSKLQ